MNTFREKLAAILLLACFAVWLASVFNTPPLEMDPTAIGPFQFMPGIFWLGLFLAVLLVLYLNLTPASSFLRYLSLAVVGLFTLGTLAVILTYGISSPDSYSVVSMGRIAFQEGTIAFGHPYVASFPTAFIFTGVLQELLGISTTQVIRFSPFVTLAAYLCGMVILVTAFFKELDIREKTVLSVAGFSFLAYAVFMYSLGARIDPVPQGFALMLLPFTLGFYMRKASVGWLFLSLVSLGALISTHFLTSGFVVAMLIGTLLMLDRKALIKMLLPVVGWLSWVVYVGVYQLQGAMDYIQRSYALETRFEAVSAKVTGVAETGVGISGAETYLQLRMLTLALIAILLGIGFSYLLMRKRRVARLVVVLLISCAPVLFFWFSSGTEFLTRIVEMMVPLAAVIFGFGLYEALRKWEENAGGDRIARIRINSNIRVVLRAGVAVLVLAGSFLSVLTASHSEIVFGHTRSQMEGNKFIVVKSQQQILSHRPLALEYPDYQTSFRETWTGADVEKAKDFPGIIAISAQWKNHLQIQIKQEETPLHTMEEWLEESPTAARIYDNGGYQAYRNHP